MASSEDAERRRLVEEIRRVLEGYPVRLAILFGSHARDEAADRSDIDVAVEFDEDELDPSRYNERFLGLGAELEVELSTNVDLVDLRKIDPAIGRRIVEDGVLLVGSHDRLDELASEFRTRTTDEEPPLERFDEALERIDEHLA